MNNVKTITTILFLFLYFFSSTSFSNCETKFHAAGLSVRMEKEDFDAARKAIAKMSDNADLDKKTRCKQFENAKSSLQQSIEELVLNKIAWNAIYNSCNPPVSLKARNAEKEITLEIINGEKILDGLLKLTRKYCNAASFKD